MIRSLVFHIGDPKNGSSSIQAALQARAWRCESVSIVPQEELNASALANAINPAHTNPEKYRRQITAKQEWARAHDADLGVISAEFFSAVPPEALQDTLARDFPDHVGDARVIAYVRPHAPRLVSSYAQRVKAGAASGDFDQFLKLSRQRSKFSYAGRFAGWRAAFGGRFALRPFIREEMAGKDVISDFFHTMLDGAAFDLTPVPRTNESLSLEEVAGMRVVQRVLTESGVPPFLRQSFGGAVGRTLAGQAGRSENRLYLGRKWAGMVAGQYREDARALDAEFFTGAPMERALDKAVADAPEDQPPVDPDLYFSPRTQAELRALADRVAQLVNKRPHAWRRDYQAQIGQLKREDRPDRDQKRNARAVWKALNALCPLLAAGRAQAG